jgi:hypothetical protein
MAIWKFSSNNKEQNTVSNNHSNDEILIISDSQKWVNTVKKLFDDNIAMDLLNIYVECGMSKEIAFSKNVDLINENIPIKKDTKENDIFRTYQRAVSERYAMANCKLPFCEMNPAEYGLNIPANETILHIIYNVILHEEKTVRRDIIYSGVRWSNGLLRAGSISAIGNEIKNFVPVDAGKLVITDKRLIFVGSQKHVTKAIKISDVLMYNLYKEGILIRQANKKPVLMEFEYFDDFEIFQIQDGLNQFIIVLDRVVQGNYNQDNSNELSWKEKGYDSLLIDIALYLFELDDIRTSAIQRKFSIPYTRTSDIFEQLQMLGVISTPDIDGSMKMLIKQDELGNIISNAPICYEKELSSYDIAELNRNNPYSCERELNDNEVKIQTIGFFDKYASVIKDEMNIRKSFIEAEQKGYNFFVISKEEYNRINSNLL